MKIEDYIPEGIDNAARASDIARWTGLDERQVRRLINKARQSVVILNFQDKNGYFIPVMPDDKELVARWLRQEESRLKNHALALRAARKCVKRCDDDGLDSFLPELLRGGEEDGQGTEVEPVRRDP